MSAVAPLFDAAERFGARRADDQLELGHNECELDRQRWRDLLSVIRSIQAKRQPKRVADDLGVSESRLSNCNAERNGNHHPLAHLPYYVRVGGDEIVRTIAQWRRLEVGRTPSITPEEALIGLLRAVTDRFGKQIVEPLLADAHAYAIEEAKGKR